MRCLLENQKTDNKVNFYPARCEKVLENWMNDCHDWCISRQLWWGHRIPAYYCDECVEINVAKEMPKQCKKCGSTHLTQDEDTLDTWFSSALWPFSTLGWPNKESEDLKTFYPTNVLVTGYDIIFFWVARMIFSAIEHTGEVPFKDVFIHGIVRDSLGRKMSKSLGNGIDPLEIIEKYGTDALRFSLVLGISPGNDIRYMPEKLESAANFANKLWNASKFVLGNLEEIDYDTMPQKLCYEDKWILSKLNKLIKETTINLNNYDLGVWTQKVYDFIWGEFCDWYIEMVKPRLYDKENKTREAAQYTLNKVLGDSLKLLHPIMPFITEEIYTKLYNNDESIMISSWPKYSEEFNFAKEEKQIEKIKQIIIGIRNIRTNMNVHPAKKSTLIFVTENDEEMIIDSREFIKKLGFADKIIVQGNKNNIPQNAMSVLSEELEVYLPFDELVDIEEEKKRLQGEKQKLEAEVERASKMLSNPGFVNKAPENKIKEEKEKLERYKQMLENVEERLSKLA